MRRGPATCGGKGDDRERKREKEKEKESERERRERERESREKRGECAWRCDEREGRGDERRMRMGSYGLATGVMRGAVARVLPERGKRGGKANTNQIEEKWMVESEERKQW